MKSATHPHKQPTTSRAKQLLTKEIHIDRTLFAVRMRELDQEFAKQSKQLAAKVKHLRHKLTRD